MAVALVAVVGCAPSANEPVTGERGGLAGAEPTAGSTNPTTSKRSAYTRIEAESFDEQLGTQPVPGAVGYLDAGDRLVYRGLDFGEGARSVTFDLAVPTDANNAIELRLDAPEGAVVGKLTPRATGAWSTTRPQSVELSAAVNGVHDLYLVMVGGNDVANLDAFVFSTGSSPAVPPTPVATAGSVNSVQTIIDDMTLSSSYPIAKLQNGQIVESTDGYPNKMPSMAMANLPRGDAAPSYWNPSPGFEVYKGSSVYWKTVLPWIVVLTGTGNNATNTRIELRNIKAYYKGTRDGQWHALNDNAIGGFNCPPGRWDNCDGVTDIRTEPSGIVSLLPSGTGSNFHGWGSTTTLPDPTDIAIFFATVQARLVVHSTSASDDRSNAQYMLHVGADYYPELDIRVAQLGGYNPGLGYSRSKAITTDWQSFNFATLDTASNFQFPHGGTVSAGTLVAAPPPLD